MIWKFAGNTPVYQQIMEQIEGAVLAGVYTPGQRIPSVRELAMEAQVNPNTMQHALQELERTQLLVTLGTSGRFVTERQEVLDAFRAEKLMDLTAQFAERFLVLGVSVSEAINLLQKYENERVNDK